MLLKATANILHFESKDYIKQNFLENNTIAFVPLKNRQNAVYTYKHRPIYVSTALYQIFREFNQEKLFDALDRATKNFDASDKATKNNKVTPQQKKDRLVKVLRVLDKSEEISSPDKTSETTNDKKPKMPSLKTTDGKKLVELRTIAPTNKNNQRITNDFYSDLRAVGYQYEEKYFFTELGLHPDIKKNILKVLASLAASNNSQEATNVNMIDDKEKNNIEKQKLIDEIFNLSQQIQDYNEKALENTMKKKISALQNTTYKGTTLKDEIKTLNSQKEQGYKEYLIEKKIQDVKENKKEYELIHEAKIKQLKDIYDKSKEKEADQPILDTIKEIQASFEKTKKEFKKTKENLKNAEQQLLKLQTVEEYLRNQEKSRSNGQELKNEAKKSSSSKSLGSTKDSDEESKDNHDGQKLENEAKKSSSSKSLGSSGNLKMTMSSNTSPKALSNQDQNSSTKASSHDSSPGSSGKSFTDAQDFTSVTETFEESKEDYSQPQLHKEHSQSQSNLQSTTWAGQNAKKRHSDDFVSQITQQQFNPELAKSKQKHASQIRIEKPQFQSR